MNEIGEGWSVGWQYGFVAGWTVNWLMLQSGWLTGRLLGVQCTDLGSHTGGGVGRRGMIARCEGREVRIPRRSKLN